MDPIYRTDNELPWAAYERQYHLPPVSWIPLYLCILCGIVATLGAGVVGLGYLIVTLVHR